jgi:hypothetical protein
MPGKFKPERVATLGRSFYQIGCGSVIHPLSEPMEGVILYMSLGPFFKLDLKKVYIKTWADAGFQLPTMSLQWYGSGFLSLEQDLV